MVNQELYQELQQQKKFSKQMLITGNKIIWQYDNMGNSKKTVIHIPKFSVGQYRSSLPEVFCKKGVLKKLGKIDRKAPVREFLFQ